MMEEQKLSNLPKYKNISVYRRMYLKKGTNAKNRSGGVIVGGNNK